jgi:hypothetical protein
MRSATLRTYRPLFVSAALALTAACLSACGGAMAPTPASNAVAPFSATNPAPAVLKFRTLNSVKDPTFNQLLGINNLGKISGYYGSGATGHPNKGYLILPPYGQKNYRYEDYPGSAQTQVTGLNNSGSNSGFWVDAKNVNRGFIDWHGVFTSYRNPKTGTGTVNQLLGINDSGIAVGFYTDGAGTNHGYTLDHSTGKFTAVAPPGATNVTASGINDAGDVTGFYGPPSASVGFLRKGKHFSTFSYPGSVATQAFGINIHDQIVGAYVDSANKMHGFLLSSPLHHASWRKIDDPNGIGTTTINGIDDKGRMVGFYVDGTGNTDGMLIEP